MKHNIVVSAMFAVALSGCSTVGTVESTENLGFGFHHDVIAESTANSAESIAHFDYLFYRHRRLSKAHKFAVSPSGGAIVYQDGPSGNVFVFWRERDTIAQLTSSFPGLAERFVWHESEGYITAFVRNADKGSRWMKLILN
jgi:hypothetical protein